MATERGPFETTSSVRAALASGSERWERPGPAGYRNRYETTAIGFDRITIDSFVVDDVVTELWATLGGDPVRATELEPAFFPATVEDFVEYFDRHAAHGDLITVTMDEHGWCAAEGEIEPVPAAADGGFGWTLSIEVT